MRIRLKYSLSFAISAFLFISSVACIIFQPDLTYVSILWEVALAGSTLLIALSALTKRKLNLASKTGVVLALRPVLHHGRLSVDIHGNHRPEG